MFIYNKKLQYPVKIARPNPRLASVIISQYGGPDGELGASLRYLSQRYSMPFDEQKALLTDIGTEGSKKHPPGWPGGCGSLISRGNSSRNACRRRRIPPRRTHRCFHPPRG